MIGYELGKFINTRGRCIGMGQSSFLLELSYIWKSRECPICNYRVHFWLRFLRILGRIFAPDQRDRVSRACNAQRYANETLYFQACNLSRFLS